MGVREQRDAHSWGRGRVKEGDEDPGLTRLGKLCTLNPSWYVLPATVNCVTTQTASKKSHGNDT
jgi:hypothetical protein